MNKKRTKKTLRMRMIAVGSFWIAAAFLAACQFPVQPSQNKPDTAEIQEQEPTEPKEGQKEGTDRQEESRDPVQESGSQEEGHDPVQESRSQEIGRASCRERV